MQDDARQDLQPRSSSGYRPLLPAGLTSGFASSTLSYVATAVALGLFVGLALAVIADHARVAAAPQIATSPTTAPTGPVVAPAHTAGQILHSAAPVPRSAAMSARPTAQVRYADGTHPRRDGIHSRPSQFKDVSDRPVMRRVAFQQKHGLIVRPEDQKNPNPPEQKPARQPYVSPNEPSAANEPTIVEPPDGAPTGGPFVIGIQGDNTVAYYDAATGTVQTYEGETYVLAQAASEGSGVQWQNYPFNIHYRCDNEGNCTLSHGGASAIAKLAR
jgi:hypothetical protein